MFNTIRLCNACWMWMRQCVTRVRNAAVGHYLCQKDPKGPHIRLYGEGAIVDCLWGCPLDGELCACEERRKFPSFPKQSIDSTWTLGGATALYCRNTTHIWGHNWIHPTTYLFFVFDLISTETLHGNIQPSNSVWLTVKNAIFYLYFYSLF